MIMLPFRMMTTFRQLLKPRQKISKQRKSKKKVINNLMKREITLSKTVIVIKVRSNFLSIQAKIVQRMQVSKTTRLRSMQKNCQI